MPPVIAKPRRTQRALNFRHVFLLMHSDQPLNVSTSILAMLDWRHIGREGFKRCLGTNAPQHL